MKHCSDSLINELNSAMQFQCCDLFKLELNDGKIYYIADYDRDVAYNGHVYKSDLFMMQREQTEQTGTPSVDTMSVTIFADQNHDDNINGEFIFSAIHNGTLDQSHLTLSRAFFNEEKALLGVIQLFIGRCEIDTVGGLGARLSCKSEMTGLAGLIPLRIFAPQNTYETGSGGKIITSSEDKNSCVIPMKPSQNVLIKL